MFRRLRSHTTTILIAMVTAAVTAGGPAVARTIADYASDAHKVDGLHAVGAGASKPARAGKLVATNGRGRLPNNIIAKAPDANTLDGIDSGKFLRTTGKAANADKLDGLDSKRILPGTGLPSGTTLRGVYGVGQSQSAGAFLDGTVSFLWELPSAPEVHLLEIGDPIPAECPGTATNPEAAKGHLCIYEARAANHIYLNVISPTGNIVNTATRWGFMVEIQSAGNTNIAFSRGTWAVTTP